MMRKFSYSPMEAWHGPAFVPFMKLESDEDFEKLVDLGQRTIEFFADNALEHERTGEMIERIGLVNFLEGIGVEVDATGIKNLQVEMRFPEHWTQEEIRAFSGTYGIHFELLINGEKGDWMVNGVMRSLDTQDAHTRVWHCRAANLVPLALLQQIKELSLIPTLDYRTAYYALLPDQTGELVVRGDETQFQLDQPFRIWNDFTGGFDVQKVEFPQYAITFHIPGADSVTHD